MRVARAAVFLFHFFLSHLLLPPAREDGPMRVVHGQQCFSFIFYCRRTCFCRQLAERTAQPPQFFSSFEAFIYLCRGTRRRAHPGSGAPTCAFGCGKLPVRPPIAKKEEHRKGASMLRSDVRRESSGHDQLI